MATGFRTRSTATGFRTIRVWRRPHSAAKMSSTAAGSVQDELRDFLRVRNHRQVTTVDLDRRRVHSLRQKSLQLLSENRIGRAMRPPADSGPVPRRGVRGVGSLPCLSARDATG